MNASPLSTQLEPLPEQDQEALDTVDESVKIESKPYVQEPNRRHTAKFSAFQANQIVKGI